MTHTACYRTNRRFCIATLAIVTLAVSLLIVALAEPLAAFFATPLLAGYIYIQVIAYFLVSITWPLYALLGRELAFGRIAAVDVLSTLVQAGVSILLVRAGWNILGIASAAVISALVCMIACFVLKPAFCG